MRKYVAAGLLVAIVFFAGLWVRAQVVQPPNVSTPTIISGADVGFRVERWDGDTPIGRWVVRSSGQWVEPRTTMSPRRLASH
jgi:hypothetical protein